MKIKSLVFIASLGAGCRSSGMDVKNLVPTSYDGQVEICVVSWERGGTELHEICDTDNDGFFDEFRIRGSKKVIDKRDYNLMRCYEYSSEAYVFRHYSRDCPITPSEYIRLQEQFHNVQRGKKIIRPIGTKVMEKN